MASVPYSRAPSVTAAPRHLPRPFDELRTSGGRIVEASGPAWLPKSSPPGRGGSRQAGGEGAPHAYTRPTLPIRPTAPPRPSGEALNAAYPAKLTVWTVSWAKTPPRSAAAPFRSPGAGRRTAPAARQG